MISKMKKCIEVDNPSNSIYDAFSYIPFPQLVSNFKLGFPRTRRFLCKSVINTWEKIDKGKILQVQKRISKLRANKLSVVFFSFIIIIAAYFIF